MLSRRILAGASALLLVIAALATSGAEARTRGCSIRYGAHCPARHGRVRAHGSGRVISPVLAPQPRVRQAPLPRPDFAPRPVQPGRFAPLEFQQNHLPPVFAPQPIK